MQVHKLQDRLNQPQAFVMQVLPHTCTWELPLISPVYVLLHIAQDVLQLTSVKKTPARWNPSMAWTRPSLVKKKFIKVKYYNGKTGFRVEQ